ncbi:bifunctional DNA-formamidopyrimidine glycosylase/DNA-(apurinic or apyrimidinic site) lyase [Candidatus Saccharibacteria bacterium]|nr:bifunctional DNA-formamidopyrimidine glycosylase/DNA-(apurinic or apyrimidinic site) lyase [Candidatus Saccharibacteria bacterium]
MPELPEVETIRRGLSDCLVKEKGGKVLRVTVLSGKSFIGEPSRIMGTEVEEIRRKGKALIFDFKNRFSMICHLRMTGQLIWVGEGERFAGGHPNDNFISELPNGQTRVIIKFEKGTLFFNDQRKFGFMKVLPTTRVEDDDFIRSLAKEPWAMKTEEFYRHLMRHKNTPIKMAILDQTVIAGLGNIYADEALYYAKIHPKQKTGEVTEEEAKLLLEGARKVMEKSLEAGGSTIRNYVKSDGTKGDYLELFAEVFNRQGQKCRRCEAEIVKTKVGGRGTHYCPECQKRKNLVQ